MQPIRTPHPRSPSYRSSGIRFGQDHLCGKADPGVDLPGLKVATIKHDVHGFDLDHRQGQLAAPKNRGRCHDHRLPRSGRHDQGCGSRPLPFGVRADGFRGRSRIHQGDQGPVPQVGGLPPVLMTTPVSLEDPRLLAVVSQKVSRQGAGVRTGRHQAWRSRSSCRRSSAEA